MRAALAAGEMDSRVVLLGTVLWGAELMGAVLGWRAPVDHVTLGHYAARDWLGIAIRNVAGARTDIPRPYIGGVGGPM